MRIIVRSVLQYRLPSRPHKAAFANMQMLTSIGLLRSGATFRAARTILRQDLSGRRAWTCQCGIGARNLSSSSAIEHEAFLAKEAAVTPCALLPSVLQLLQLDSTILKPAEYRADLHPFLIPLAAENGGNGEIVGFLRTPMHAHGDKLPVVTTEGPTGLRLLARDARELLARRGAEAQYDEDMDGAAKAAVLGAVNAQEAISSGSERPDSRLPLNKYLALKVGSFPDVNEELALMHLERGDETAALVAADRNARHHGTWGRSFLFQASMFVKVGRGAEAKDAYRMALMSPLWSLGADPRSTATQAGVGDVEEFTSKVVKMAEEAREVELQQGTRTVAEVAVERGDHLLDTVCLGAHQGWAEVRTKLAEIYSEGGHHKLAKFVSRT